MRILACKRDKIVWFVTVVILGLGTLPAQAVVSIKIVPQPKSITSNGNDMVISTPVIRITSASENLKNRVADMVAELGLTEQSSEPNGGIELTLTYGTEEQAAGKVDEQGEQGYTLVTSKSDSIISVDITGGNEAGAYYGLCTFRQLIVWYGSDLVIPQVTIDDWPTIKRRGAAILKEEAVTNYVSRLKLNYDLGHRMVNPEFYKNRYMEGCNLSGYKGHNLISMWDEGSEDGKQAIRNFYERKYNEGLRSLTAMFDDMGVKNADMHASIAKEGYDHLMSIDPSVKFTFCPPQYFGMLSKNPNKAYHITADSIIPQGVEFFWSGKGVFSTEITTEMVSTWIANLGNPNRKLFIWDNQSIRWAKSNPPSPLKNRSADLNTVISGYMANMNNEANWNYQNRNAETVLVTVAMYTWNPEAYNETTAWEIARDYVDNNLNVWATENYTPVASNGNIITRENSPISFNLPAKDANGEPLIITILSEPSNGSLAGASKNQIYTPDADFIGTDSFTYKVNDGTVDSNTATITIDVLAEDQPVTIAVNCGGSDYTAGSGITYLADYGFSGGKEDSTTSAIANTEDDPLYNSNRWKSGGFSYAFQVPNGTYDVTLKWAETHFSGAGSRVMNVLIEGQPVINNLDIASAAGGINTAFDQTVTVIVTDDYLNIRLADVLENPLLSAILVVEVLDPVVDPEIQLTGNSKTIDSGDTSPTTADHTDFGVVTQGGGTKVRTFTIKNTGSGVLNLSGTPRVSLTGSSDFVVTTQPPATVSAGANKTFKVTFTANSSGTQSATVSIANNDSDENPYTFEIEAEGLAPSGPDVSLAVDKVDIAENGGEATFTATLSEAAPADVSISLAFTGDATQGSDYTVSASQIVIPADSLSGTITVTGKDDTAVESDETAIVTIASATNATVGSADQEQIIITDDETVESGGGGCGSLPVGAGQSTSLPLIMLLVSMGITRFRRK